MRLLLEDKANDVMDEINNILLQPDINPFKYQPLNTRILSGEEEGAFAWISLNYLNGFFHRRAGDTCMFTALYYCITLPVAWIALVAQLI